MLQIIILAASAVLIGLDQWTKWLAVTHLKEQSPVVLWDGVFEFFYTENTGAAFGMLKEQRWIFITVTIVVLLAVLAVLLSGRFRKHPLVNISGILIIAGGVGNLIDRIALGYVVDFLYFKLIDFPIFNVADCCVVIGAILLLVYFFFFYKEEKTAVQAEGEEHDGNENTVSDAGTDGHTA